jgi:hypothetical protein
MADIYAVHEIISDSGSPVTMLLRIDRIPARAAELMTNFQSTCSITAVVPITAIALCATVLMALFVAHFKKIFVSSFIVISYVLTIKI